ncbi:hypothetical protein LMG32289_05575 [Cupriavidus pampae]|jgi:hypothetical protein|uniref:Uncharacterized protein n=1 Tax=Cupriavidus pampae TaxID=659251 RepID=A0ABN7ZF28_9BURK|nr:hypothetical protein LMG32289_05575 [Cupriavidus pampae]
MSDDQHVERMNVVLDLKREADQQLLAVLRGIPNGVRMHVCRLVLMRGLADLDEGGLGALIADACRDQVGRGRKSGPKPGSRRKVAARLAVPVVAEQSVTAPLDRTAPVVEQDKTAAVTVAAPAPVAAPALVREADEDEPPVAESEAPAPTPVPPVPPVAIKPLVARNNSRLSRLDGFGVGGT